VAAEFDLVVWDGDDTLWETEPLYDLTRAQVRAFLESQGFDGQNWERRQRALDLQRVPTLGFSKSRFPGSCVLAYEELALDSPELAKQVESLAEQVFEMIAPLFPDALEVLTSVRRVSTSMVLATKGDREVQIRRVLTSGVADLFDAILIPSEKDEHLFSSLLTMFNASPNRSLSIGNSQRSDILPAASVGMRTAWLDRYVWDHEKSGLHHGRASFESLTDVWDSMQLGESR
jgi:putative hydrolase of the HAD superfamily